MEDTEQERERERERQTTDLLRSDMKANAKGSENIVKQKENHKPRSSDMQKTKGHYPNQMPINSKTNVE